MKIEIIKSFEELKSIENEWEELLMESASNDFFLTPAWFFAWWPIFGKNKQLFVVLFRQDKKLVGLFPLYKTVKSFFTVITFSGYPVQTDRMDFIIAPEYENECVNLFKKMIFSQKDWDLLSLRDFSVFSNHAEILYTLSKRKGRRIIRLLDEPYYYVKTSNYVEFDVYLRNAISRRSFKTFKNMRNRLKKNGIEFDIANNVTPELIEEMEELDLKRSVRGVNGLSFFNIPENKIFIKKLINSTFGKNNFLLLRYRSNEKLIAFLVVFNWKNKLGAYLISTDMDFNKIGLGTLIFFQGIDYCIKHGFDEFDFLKGGEAYKNSFTCNHRRGNRLLLYRGGFKSHLLYFYHKKIKPLRKKINNDSILWKIIPQRIRGKFDI